MALTPSTTTFPVITEGVQFTQTVSYLTEDTSTPPGGGSEEGGGTEPTLVPAIVTSVTSSISDPAITITTVDNSVTISGMYTMAFPGKSFEYIPIDSTSTVTSSYEQVPAHITALITFNPVTVLTTTVTYTVNTEAGSATITQVVNNTWDAGKAQMQTVLSRGTF